MNTSIIATGTVLDSPLSFLSPGTALEPKAVELHPAAVIGQAKVTVEGTLKIEAVKDGQNEWYAMETFTSGDESPLLHGVPAHFQTRQQIPSWIGLVMKDLCPDGVEFPVSYDLAPTKKPVDELHSPASELYPLAPNDPNHGALATGAADTVPLTEINAAGVPIKNAATSPVAAEPAELKQAADAADASPHKNPAPEGPKGKVPLVEVNAEGIPVKNAATSPVAAEPAELKQDADQGAVAHAVPSDPPSPATDKEEDTEEHFDDEESDSFPPLKDPGDDLEIPGVRR